MKAAEYSWGEFRREETISKQYLKQLRKLTEQELLGFLVRNEDKTKAFYAPEEYIESGPDGIAVKFAYAVACKGKPEFTLITDIPCKGGGMVCGIKQFKS